MKCPYCNETMKSGYLLNRGETLSWTPQGERKGWTRWSVSPNGVKLGDYSFFSGGEVDASYCSMCRKVIINA